MDRKAEQGAPSALALAAEAQRQQLIRANKELAAVLRALVDLAAKTPRLNEAVHPEARNINRTLLDISGIGGAALRAWAPLNTVGASNG